MKFQGLKVDKSKKGIIPLFIFLALVFCFYILQNKINQTMFGEQKDTKTISWLGVVFFTLFS